MSAQFSAVSRGILVTPFERPLGAHVECGDVRALPETWNSQLVQALQNHLVLVFRDQHLDPGELLRFGARFGPLRLATRPPAGRIDPPNPYITIVSNVVENGRKLGGLGDGEVVWHTDNSFHEYPLSVSVLYGLEVPPGGGETGFINMYAAYDALPAALKSFVEGKTIKQDTSYVGYDTGEGLGGGHRKADVRALPGVDHPIVRTHADTGHNCLYLGRRSNAYINGCTVEESERVLDELWNHTCDERFTWYQEWHQGDVLVWDNRCVMHRRKPFDPSTRRVMHRTVCQGERPYHSPTSAREPHPRAQHFLSPNQETGP